MLGGSHFGRKFDKLQAIKIEVLSFPTLHDFRENTAFWKIPRLRLFILPVKATCTWRWVRSTGGMIVTGVNRSTRRKTCPNAMLSTTNLTWTDLTSNSGLRDERWAMARPYQVKLTWYWYIKVWIVPRILQLSYGVSKANGVRTITDVYSPSQAVTNTPSVRYVGFLEAKPGGLHDKRHRLKL